jgi:predicted GTPase
VTRVAILGAAGRDFHVFNVALRDDPDVTVACFTAAQIPGIAGRRYPAALAGPRYPHGIPIEREEDLEGLIARYRVDRVVFAYSDLSHEHVMHLASRALAAGADFDLLGPRRTMLTSRRPVIAITAVRTGCGKSAVARRVVDLLRARGRRPVVVRHPMPYGDLVAARVQRFATAEDLDRAGVTIEEREEYEPHLDNDAIVFAGVDYGAVLAAAEAEGDTIVWDGGNNDLPFFTPTRHLCLVDPFRPDDVARAHPGETNARMADTVLITKVDTAPPAAIERVRTAVRAVNARAAIVEVALPVRLDAPERLAGRRVLVVEDGPSLTHGNLPAGAGEIASRRHGATLVDPRPWAAGTLRDVFARYPALGPVLPAMGYSAAQRAELAATIEAVSCDLVVSGTPIDLARALSLRRPVARVRYDAEECRTGALAAVLDDTLTEEVHR